MKTYRINDGVVIALSNEIIQYKSLHKEGDGYLRFEFQLFIAPHLSNIQ